MKFWKSGLQLLIYRQKKHFSFNKYCSTYMLKFFPANRTDSIWFLQMFTSRFIELPLCDLRVFIELSAQIIANYIQTYWLIILYVPYKLSIAQLKKVCRWIGYVWSQFVMICADSLLNMRRSHIGSAKVGAIGRW